MAEEIKQTGQNPQAGTGNGKVDSYTLDSANAAAPGFKPVPSLSALLGPKPKFSLAASNEAEKSRTKTAKALFQITLVLAVLAYGFFYTQLNPNFTLFSEQLGQNPAIRFERSNAELSKVQTELNLIRYRMARLWLDEINSQIDPFQRQTAIADSQFSTSAEKQNALIELQILGASIKNSLIETQKILSEPLGIDVYSREPITPEQRETAFEESLKETLNKQRAALTSETNPNQDEIRIIDNVLRLVENKRFRTMIKNQDFAAISEDDFSAMLAKIREEGTDELSLIDKVRSNRLDWGTIIQDIHGVTRKADLYYGQGLFKTVGGFLFSSYRFDANTKRISISGITKTADSKTFSFIAQLVDSIEKSPKFKDIDFRSFSKSKDPEGDYSSAVNLDFALQIEPDSRDNLTQPN